eukprot:CAMPEP_0206244850 /NCGR_PEP_ID=MMETSP0047_2-20121206/18383_1 /ASSEMBLY_ACC=CAM_ASM_000192 /TAXON_ID=195065 /ORGANISM="Chroomonas mesostigmatica_cf, Strain CCMP1168" /LENGTH=62 /DNA_ID=CAMNT_0053670109 /DNA_START=18 /DNA_END=206 /DNA_ORIENTATION=+
MFADIRKFNELLETFELPLVQVNYHPFDSENSGDQNVTKSFTWSTDGPGVGGTTATPPPVPV